MDDFRLDSRLESDSLPVCDLPLCQVRLMNDARFPWLVLIPRRPGIREVFELSSSDQVQLWHEATEVGRVMKDATQGDKLNLATLGNVVAQLHLHVIVRKTDDAAWPAPVWGHGEARSYDLEGQAAMRDLVLAQIQGLDLG
ncbi:histidine triad (HIT) protein [Litchfieldella qijiaojingensis]|uniref:Histidine triad (HIT) protein n=1 Tax=Litchfieldella qijiaojingensis TaxID=980347 RepID=A0ABQ2YY89_9GAMM|nr:HIT domain-containing protein [Halomonas qijiaojingensis]GGX99373.1 histidine triad (HIT) protein [Halomonas qijiaojingensis]